MGNGFTTKRDSSQILLLCYDSDTASLRTTPSGGSSGAPENSILMQDANGPFLRNFVFAEDGTIVSFNDTDLEGTPYTPSGETVYFKTYETAETPAYYSYTVPVTTAAWTELVASLGSPINRMEIFDSSGKLLMLGVGPEGEEGQLLNVYPGGNGMIDVKLPGGIRLSIKAIDADATTGFITINFYV